MSIKPHVRASRVALANREVNTLHRYKRNIKREIRKDTRNRIKTKPIMSLDEITIDVKADMSRVNAEYHASAARMRTEKNIAR